MKIFSMLRLLCILNDITIRNVCIFAFNRRFKFVVLRSIKFFTVSVFKQSVGFRSIDRV